MIQVDECALICDLAETYGIFNYKGMQLRLIATLASGLGEHSRIKKKLSGMNVEIDTMLLASIADKLSLLWWAKTQDGQKNRNRPDMILNKMLAMDAEVSDIITFGNCQSFEKRRNELLGKEGIEWQPS